MKDELKSLNEIKTLNDNIGSAILIAGYTPEVERVERKRLGVFKNVEATKTYLSYNSASNFNDLTLIHGTITKADSIPVNIDDCLDIFVIIPRANFEGDDLIVKCKDLEYLQQVIVLVTSEEVDIEYIESNADFNKDFEANILYDVETKDIEDLYILYGYEIELYFSFTEDAMDEGLVDDSQTLYKEMLK